MLKFAHDLSDEYEYAIVWWGQSNAQPKGTRAAGLAAAPHLALPNGGGAYATTHFATAGGISVYTVSGGTTGLVGYTANVGSAVYAGADSLAEGYGKVIAVTLTTVSVLWSLQPATPSSVTSLLITPPPSARSYDNVRVLTPFLPEETNNGTFGVAGSAYDASAPFVAGYAFDVDSWADVGLFLPYTPFEGVSAGKPISLTVSGSTYTVPHDSTNLKYQGGRIIVTADGHATLAYGTVTGIVAGASDTLYVTWDTDPPADGSYTTSELRVPTPWDSANADLIGFRYPNNTHQPGFSSGTSSVLSPLGRTSPCYVPASGGLPQTKFGAMLEFAWRLSQELGRRINVIDLSWNGASLLASSERLGREAGWVQPTTAASFAPTEANGLAARLQRLVATVAPAAMRAEGGKPLRVLAIVGFQGEYEAGTASGTPQYRAALTSFYSWLRGVIEGAGLSPYSRPTKIPVIHPGVGLAWTTAAEGTTLNEEIAQFALADGWAKTFDTTASGIGGADGSDLIHFNGAGEAANGKAAAEAAVELIDRAVGQATNDPGTLRICNLALSYIGDTATVTSIYPSDGSVQATLCARFYPVARDTLLESGQWSFASRRVALQEVTNTLTEWDYAYAVPADCLTALVVTPSGADDDYRVGSVFDLDAAAVLATSSRKFVIEADAHGNRTLYTDEADAKLRYVSRVTDTDLYPSLFVQALAWHLASMLAGAIIKGEAGAAEARRCQQMAAYYTSKAAPADARQREVKPDHLPPWLADR